MQYKITKDYHYRGATLKEGNVMTLVEIAEALNIEPNEDMFKYFCGCLGLGKCIEQQNDNLEKSNLVHVDRMFVCEEEITSNNEVVFTKEQKVSETELKEKLGNSRFGKLLKQEKISEIKIIADSDV